MKNNDLHATWLLFGIGTILFSTAGLAGESNLIIKGKPIAKLIKQLRGSNRGLQLRAARALSGADKEQHPAIVPFLIPILKSSRENDRFVAAQTLGNYGPVSHAAVPNLLPMLKGTQYERNRTAAAAALGLILPDAKPSDEVDQVVAALLPLFKDKYSDVRREAVRACGRIGPAAKACIPHLPHRLKEGRKLGYGGDEGFLVRKAASWTCSRMGPLAREHIDLLISMLPRDGRINPSLIDSIGSIGPVHENVVPNLVDFYERHRSNKATLNVFEKFGPKAALVVPLINRFLGECFDKYKHNGPELCVRQMQILSAIGPAAKEAIPVVKKLANLKKWYRVKNNRVEAVRKQGQKTLIAIGGVATEPVEVSATQGKKVKERKQPRKKLIRSK